MLKRFLWLEKLSLRFRRISPSRVNKSNVGQKETWEKIQAGFVAASTVSKVNLLTTIANTCYESGKDLSTYFAELDSCFNELASMGLPVTNGMQVTILLGLLIKEIIRIGTALKTAEDNKGTWNRVCSGLLDDYLSRGIFNRKILHPLGKSITAAIIKHKTNKRQRQTCCYIFDKPGCIACNCKAGRRQNQDDKLQKILIATVPKECSRQGLLWMQKPTKILKLNQKYCFQLKKYLLCSGPCLKVRQ